MDSELSPTQLIERWKQGDQYAAQLLFERYASRLAELAASRMERRIGRRVNGEDVVQSAFSSFFQRTADNKLQINNARDLWNLLVTITIAKTRSTAREHRAQKRTVEAEVSAPQSAWLAQELAQEPSPSEAAILVEQIELVTRDLPEKHQEILSLRMAGHMRTEIAEIMGLSRQTIYRVLSLIEQRFNKLNTE